MLVSRGAMGDNKVLAELQERSKVYYKFTKVLALKVAQVVVQSRQGKKVEPTSSDPPDAPQWFNLSIPDDPLVADEASQALREATANNTGGVSLCIEISLQATEVDRQKVALEQWSVRLSSGVAPCSPSAAYVRMGVMLRSALSVSRVTPAYKLARTQHHQPYCILHKIYAGEPALHLLGEERKAIKVSELATPIGTLTIEVCYRTALALPPAPRASPAPSTKRRPVDLARPLTTAAFVDEADLRRLHAALGTRAHDYEVVQENDRAREALTASDEQNANAEPSCSTGAPPPSRALDVPRSDKFSGLMEFPFAEGSPIAELATFYQECVEARVAGASWPSPGTTDREDVARQLRVAEEQVPEFDDLLADMLRHADH